MDCSAPEFSAAQPEVTEGLLGAQRVIQNREVPPTLELLVQPCLPLQPLKQPRPLLIRVTSCCHSSRQHDCIPGRKKKEEDSVASWIPGPGEAMCPWIRVRLDPGSGGSRAHLGPGEATHPLGPGKPSPIGAQDFPSNQDIQHLPDLEAPSVPNNGDQKPSGIQAGEGCILRVQHLVGSEQG
ncbi:hypothetical protein QTO34_000110 [Cnephaeus nilssonii]|uniref:Uncharacterized protein n=1 Tax=Cnephaeus nilssonii TaxID=3371016 RepID=A0AA40IBA9_CNENI|nr:hypothetical protein QTO34_000110 [Eptesicus nilssonii]